MKKGYIFANTKITLTSLEDFFSVLPDFQVSGSLHFSMGKDIVIADQPDIIFLSDELTSTECLTFLNEIEKTSLFDNISIVYVVFELSEHKKKWLLSEKRIDAWLSFNVSSFERQYCIEKILERMKYKKQFHALQMKNDSLQSTCTKYEYKTKFEQKTIEKNSVDVLLGFVQTIRQYLSSIEGAAAILSNPVVDREGHAEAASVLKKNIIAFKHFLEEKNSFYEEKKLLFQGIKIATVSKIMASMKERILFLAKQRNVQLNIHTSELQQAIIGRGEDFLYIIQSIVSEFINLMKPNSIVDFYIQTTESALLVNFSLETQKQYLQMDELVETFGKDNVCRRMLDSIGAQFEFMQRDHQVGIKFYLPRLS